MGGVDLGTTRTLLSANHLASALKFQVASRLLSAPFRPLSWVQEIPGALRRTLEVFLGLGWETVVSLDLYWGP